MIARELFPRSVKLALAAFPISWLVVADSEKNYSKHYYQFC
jgi:hypothetical protein